MAKVKRIKPSRREADEAESNVPTGIPPRPQEQLLIELIPRLDPRQVICNTAGRGQFARQLAMAKPQVPVTCLFQDLYPLQQSQRYDIEAANNLQRLCQADFPDGEVDLAVVICSAHGIADLSRDLLQQAHDRLVNKGKLLAAIDNPEDQWLHDELKKLFPKVTREPQKQGVVYSAVKASPLKKHKNFDAEFAFRDQGRMIYAHSRPGVFSHRRLDVGARALMNAMEVHPKMRILDLGCGTGAVALAAALRQPDAEVWASDSNPRAVQCAELGAVRNGVTNLTACLDADGTNLPEGHFDLILANPPYYSHYRLAEVFLGTTVHALEADGELLLVTKAPAWFRENLPDWFRHVDERTQKDYIVFSCRQAFPTRRQPRP